MTNSWTATAWATKVSAGHPPMARFVLIVGLAVRCGERHGNRVFPSIECISEDTGIGQTSVKKWLKYLEDNRLIIRRPTRRKDGTKGANSYILPIKAEFGIDQEQQSDSDYGDDHGRNLINPRSEFDQSTVGFRPSYEQESEEQESENKSQIERSASDEFELPLGLEPLRPKEPTAAEVASFIEEEWRARAFVRPIQGGRLSADRAEKARDLGREAATNGQNAIDVWREIFERIDDGDFLQGKTAPAPGFSQFRLKMDWILQKRNFTKVLGGLYDGKQSTDRRHGSTTVAVARVFERIRDGELRGSGQRPQAGPSSGGSGQLALSDQTASR